MTAFEHVYRVLARMVLPRRWRGERGDELVATAVSGSPLRELVALLGLAVRLRACGPGDGLGVRRWLADGLRTAVVLVTALVFGFTQAPRHLPGGEAFTAAGGSTVLFDAAWLAAVVLLGLRRPLGGVLLGMVGATALLMSSDVAVGLGDALIDAPGHAVQPVAWLLGGCAVAWFAADRIRPAERGDASVAGVFLALVPPVVARVAMQPWWGCAAASDGGQAGPGAMAAAESCWLLIERIAWWVPAAVLGVLAVLAALRVGRDPRSALGVGAATVVAGSFVRVWVSPPTAGATVLAAAMVACGCLLIAAGAVRVFLQPGVRSAA